MAPVENKTSSRQSIPCRHEIHKLTLDIVTMLKESISNAICRTFHCDIIQDYRHKKDYREWLHSGKPIPPPDIVKQKTVRKYAEKHRTNVFVETGTYLGDMVSAVRDDFYKIYSVELSSELYERANKKFSKYKHISIFNGDSSEVLPKILNHIEESCLFWLDGHYSAGVTAKGKKETPILGELKHILTHSTENHVILIDDARCFTGQNDYPTLAELRKLILGRYPDYVFEVKDDIIRTHKKGVICQCIPTLCSK